MRRAGRVSPACWDGSSRRGARAGAARFAVRVAMWVTGFALERAWASPAGGGGRWRQGCNQWLHPFRE